MKSLEGLCWPMRKVSGWCVACLYVAFSMTDLLLSHAAFVLGVAEANPVLAWVAAHGLFVPAKVLLTAVAAALIVVLHSRRRAQHISWLALMVMGAVNVYHLLGLSAI